jgi:DnaJ-class molecular chaperone
MNYYSTLGLNRGASPDDIKKAYRSMAMKHHPDRGGDEKKFKEVEEAYRMLSDPQKKQMIDSGMDPNAHPGQGGFHNQGPFEFHFGTDNLNDIFGNFGFGFAQQRPMRKNKSLNISVEISLEDVLNGKEINAEVGIPGKKSKMINISVPSGIETGQQIRYEGMGDDSIQGLRPGDLIVNIFVKPHPEFRREGDNLYCEKTISVWDAIIGTTLDIKTIDNKTININIPAGTQPETVFGCRGEGLPNIRSKKKGTLMVRVKIEIPRSLPDSQKQIIENLKNNAI